MPAGRKSKADREAENGCHRKKFHPSRKKAVVARDAATEASGIPMSVYRCPTCSGWHLCKRKNVRPRQ